MSGVKHLVNEMVKQGERAMTNRMPVRIGKVSSFDPANYAVKCLILPGDDENPNGVETGWIPIGASWAGAGWGVFAPPPLGTMVELQFQEDDLESGLVGHHFFNNIDTPLNVPAGEWWLVHQSGSLLKFHNDGSVEMQAATNLTAGAPNGILRLVGKQVQVHATQDYRFDANGHGQHWFGDHIDTYQIGEVAGTPHAISPPEIS